MRCGQLRAWVVWCRLPAVLKAVENSAASYLHLAEDILLQQKQKAMAEHKRLQAQQGEDCRCHRQGAYAAE